MAIEALTVGAIGIGALIGAGQVAKRRLAAAHPPTGRLVDVGGFRLHIEVRGDGPTVVLEGGSAAPGAAWTPIAAQLAGFARVVTYDRAGLGWSDPSPHPRTADVLAEELHELLSAAGVPAPYLLVGHSLGGTIVRVFAHRYPEETAGLVLLDGSHEDQFVRAPEAVRAMSARMARAMPLMFGVLRMLVRLGIVALRPGIVTLPGRLPADVAAVLRMQVATNPKVYRAMAAELADLESGNDRVRALGITDLGDIPIRVVSHGRAEGTPPQLGPDVAAAFEALWQELQAAQASLSPLGSRTIATGVGHDIPGEAPELVVEAVREMLGIGVPMPVPTRVPAAATA